MKPSRFVAIHGKGLASDPERFTGYLKDYPGAVNTPDVIFWFGEYYDSKKKYDKAKEYYGAVADNYPSSGIAEEDAEVDLEP